MKPISFKKFETTKEPKRHHRRLPMAEVNRRHAVLSQCWANGTFLEALSEKIAHKIMRTEKYLDQMPKTELTSHGYWSEGYEMGKRAAFEIVQDLLDAAKEGGES